MMDEIKRFAECLLCCLDLFIKSFNWNTFIGEGILLALAVINYFITQKVPQIEPAFKYMIVRSPLSIFVILFIFNHVYLPYDSYKKGANKE